MPTMLAQPATPPPRTAARVAPIVAGSVIGLLAIVLLAVGAVALWGNGEKDDQGYLSTGTERYVTGGHAIVTEELEVDDVPGWVVDRDGAGKVRLQVSSRDDAPVFVGIARSDDAAAYLGGSEHATLTDVDYSPFRPSYREHEGDRTPAPPAEQGFWETSAHGPGTQTLTWDVDNGSWSIVVMNDDASAGVDAGVRAGVKVPWLAPVGWSAIGGSLLLLAVAGGLIYLGARTPRNRTPVPFV
jgi:hypothetical protein